MELVQEWKPSVAINHAEGCELKGCKRDAEILISLDNLAFHNIEETFRVALKLPNIKEKD